MKIAVIGAGVVGVCTAFELARDGHQVAVFERNAAVGEEASFACAGHLSPSLAHPFAFATAPRRSWLPSPRFGRGLRLNRGSTLRDVRWLYARKPGPADYAKQFCSAHQLAAYSLECMRTLAAHHALEFEHSAGQTLLCTTEADFLAFEPMLQALTGLGVPHRVLTAAQARAVEPALCADRALHSAVHFPEDATANCRQFTHLLKQQAQRLGAVFHFAQAVTHMDAGGAKVQIQTQDDSAWEFDQVVVCAGTATPVLQAAGLQQLPLTRVWSYTLSAQIRENLNAPQGSVIDHAQQLSISRLGARVRVSGGAELGTPALSRNEKASQRLFQMLQSHFPGAADFSRGTQSWRGCSAFTPDGLPLVGPTSTKGVWLNTAHGHNGWSMACGSARLLADLIRGQAPAVDATLLHAGRFAS